jgi:signal transduction histidine kinase
MFGGGLSLTIGSLLWTFRNSERIAITEFRLFLAVVALWISTQIVELLGGPATAYYASFLIRGLRGLMAFSWFYFTMTYAGYSDLVHSTTVRVVVGTATGFLILATGVPPIATELIFPSVVTTTEPLVTVSLSGVTPFHRLTQTIGYSLVLVGTTGLTFRFLTTGYTKWWRLAAVLAGTLAVVSLDLVFNKSGAFLPGVDYAALGTSAVSVLLIGVLYRHDLFASVPVGRDHLFRTLEEPVFVVDSNQRIIDRNEAARNISVGDTQIGNRIDEVLPGGTNAAEFIASATDEDSIVEIDTDDTTHWYKLTRSEPPQASDSQRTVVVLKEITEQRLRKRELKRQNERLDEFASVVSHDLRNPLNVASARLALLAEEHDSEHLAPIERAHTRMGTLIDDLLTLAQEGDVVTDPEPTDLAILATLRWENVETEGATLRTDTECVIRADASRLGQVLENLFRNATEHGGENVTITVGELEGGFYLEDDGPGIPPEERTDVFEAGYSTSEEGTGLGLNIVRQVVEAHDWEIHVTEGSEGGARFEITGVEFAAESSHSVS